eukprot:9105307-Pyramimonas_sp.AAC.1
MNKQTNKRERLGGSTDRCWTHHERGLASGEHYSPTVATSEDPYNEVMLSYPATAQTRSIGRGRLVLPAAQRGASRP